VRAVSSGRGVSVSCVISAGVREYNLAVAVGFECLHLPNTFHIKDVLANDPDRHKN
jgi:hypothetical protein